MPNPYASPPEVADIAAAVEATRGRLQCDVIDLLYLAWWDWDGRPEEGLTILRELHLLTKDKTGGCWNSILMQAMAPLARHECPRRLS